MDRPSDETRRTFLKLTGVALGAVGVTGTAAANTNTPGRGWSTFQYDAGNTGFCPVGTDPGSDAWVDWSAQLSERRLHAPTVKDGTAYVVDSAGVLTAFDTDARKTRWTVELGGQEYAPTVVDDTVYVTGSDVAALSTADGSERWRFELEVAESSPVTVAAGTLFFKTSDVNGQGTCWAIDAKAGEERWHVGVPSGKEGRNPSAENVPPAVVDGVAYFADKETVYAIDATNGIPKWQKDVDGFIDHAPTVADGTVYVCGESVCALSTADGSTKWTATVGESPRLTQSPAVADETLVIADGSRARVWALTPDDGTIQWTFDDGEGTAGTPAISGVVYVPISGDDSDGLVALDLTTGDERWRAPIRNLGRSWLSSAVDDAIYVTDREGFLYALTDPDWLEWRADTTGSLAVGHRLYVSDDELQALNSKTGKKKWAADTGTSPTVGDWLYVADESAVVAYNPGGNERWRVECDGDVLTDPAVTSERVFVGGDGWVGSFDAKTGEHYWTYRGNSDGLGEVDALAAHDGRVFAVVDGRIVAIESCGEVWSAESDGSTVAVDDAVYVGTGSNEVVTYDFDGTEEWRVTLDHGESVSSLVAEGGVYTVTTKPTSTGTDSRDWLVSIDGGEVAWTFHPKFLPFGALCDPVVADGTVYVGASDRRVYALSATDGSELRRFETGGEVTSVVVGKQVYASSDAVYSIRR